VQYEVHIVVISSLVPPLHLGMKADPASEGRCCKVDV